jgi:hypothetical protein
MNSKEFRRLTFAEDRYGLGEGDETLFSNHPVGAIVTPACGCGCKKKNKKAEKKEALRQRLAGIFEGRSVTKVRHIGLPGKKVTRRADEPAVEHDPKEVVTFCGLTVEKIQKTRPVPSIVPFEDVRGKELDDSYCAKCRKKFVEK